MERHLYRTRVKDWKWIYYFWIRKDCDSGKNYMVFARSKTSFLCRSSTEFEMDYIIYIFIRDIYITCRKMLWMIGGTLQCPCSRKLVMVAISMILALIIEQDVMSRDIFLKMRDHEILYLGCKWDESTVVVMMMICLSLMMTKKT